MVVKENLPPHFFSVPISMPIIEHFENERVIEKPSEIQLKRTPKRTTFINRTGLYDKKREDLQGFVSYSEQKSPFKAMYYSRKNLTELQKKIVEEVKQRYGYDISEQDETQLLQIMRVMDYWYSDNPVDQKFFDQELKKLNNLVISYSLPKINKGIQHYLNYIRDSNNPRHSMPDLPKFPSSTGNNKIPDTRSFYGN